MDAENYCKNKGAIDDSDQYTVMTVPAKMPKMTLANGMTVIAKMPKITEMMTMMKKVLR